MPDISERLMKGSLVYTIAQAGILGAGLLIVLMMPLDQLAIQAIPWLVASTMLLSFPVSRALAPRLSARYGRGRRRVISS